MKNIKDAVSKSIKNIRIAVMGTINSVIKADNTVNVLISDEEELRDVTVISPYGFFSLPLNDNSGQLLFNNTSRNVSLIGVEHENLPVELNPGEALVYSNSGSYMLLKDGKIFVQGDLKVTGNITYSGNISKE
jgi:phage gp45-like